MIRQGFSEKVTSKLRLEGRSHLNAGGGWGGGSAQAFENKLRLFGEQTEGPVWLERRELEGVVGREIKEALEAQRRSLDFILSAVGNHWRVLNRSAVPGI